MGWCPIKLRNGLGFDTKVSWSDDCGPMIRSKNIFGPTVWEFVHSFEIIGFTVKNNCLKFFLSIGRVSIG